MIDKYGLLKNNGGLVSWSTEGMKVLNEMEGYMESGLDLTCRRVLGEVLEDRGFKKLLPYEEYQLSDGEGRDVRVLMNDEALRVVRDGVMYNFPMHFESGADELCDLWEMIRKAWNA